MQRPGEPGDARKPIRAKSRSEMADGQRRSIMNPAGSILHNSDGSASRNQRRAVSRRLADAPLLSTAFQKSVRTSEMLY
jgi:hypothetical protein